MNILEDSQIVHDTLKPNYHGTLFATKLLLPLLRPNGRLVNVSSAAGRLNYFSPVVADRLRNASSLEDVSSFLKDFQDAVEAGKEKERGFKSAAYATSKAALNAATRIIAEEERSRGSTVLINACHPGVVNVSSTFSCRAHMIYWANQVYRRT
jgi:carbonyl reductase 1